MDIVSILPYVQILLAFVLIFLVVIQKSEAGVGGAFGGGDSSDNINSTRRGSEKVIFVLTIVVAILFVISILASTFFQLN